tara:strand:- start:791 stop:1825 length:1035 start_codon:yes stop_codon:yes gene_type:complete
MKKINLLFFVSLIVSAVFAGNEQRVGQAGGTQLLINPWARSSGWGLSNSAGVRGLEAQFGNIAGLAFTNSTELILSRTNWLSLGSGGSVGNINAFGFAQKVGESGVLAMGIMTLNFGDIDITTVDLPEGGIGNFSPSFSNIGVSYAKEFSNSIYGGFTIRVISERISNVSSGGMAFDAGIQYVTGENDKVKFGVALKNVGPRLAFKGDGLSFRGWVNDDDYTMTLEQRSEGYELPSLLNIGFSYDILPAQFHRLTTAATFTSNAFQKDLYRFGFEYSFRDMFMFRSGYVLEPNSSSDNSTFMKGPTAGFTIEMPLGGTKFGLDYSYRHSDPFQGSHSFGLRIDL